MREGRGKANRIVKRMRELAVLLGIRRGQTLALFRVMSLRFYKMSGIGGGRKRAEEEEEETPIMIDRSNLTTDGHISVENLYFLNSITSIFFVLCFHS